ncbi:MAG: tyrosine--tRNA ligase [candidate division Zixibacteria bacterium]|nr:tyrosine--tRNA ligase [candidate division Zixibacteria bacterium]MDH3938846.1 tyrosine--tRNA ligase [candidate division Zixibacteria bacterium]MDH4035559.1 tyrosine--tRNA ligase [candidate division Zixibacteria bacterium]
MSEVSDLSAQTKSELEHQIKIISRGTVDMLPKGEFESRLVESIENNRPLRVKQGFDPTSPDIHLGHSVGIRKLRQFQDLGHQIVLIVGDYTGMVGDPSGVSATRPQLTYDDIMKNAETYQTQFFKILDKSKTEVRFNGDWFKKMDFLQVMGLAGKYTVARLLERDDFTKRMRRGVPISIHELFYPLMQGYDSVAIEADVEIGATEQTFNLLAARTIQEAFGIRAQLVLTMPILVGLDGEQKMSKSLGNYIGIDEPAREIFGKVMSIPDALIHSYYELASDVDADELAQIAERLKQPDVNPMEIKKQLGRRLVDMYHPEGSGSTALEEFERVFSQKELPDEIPEVTIQKLGELGIDPQKIYLVHLIAKCGLSKSNGEARKLMAAGAVTLDGEKVVDLDYEFALKSEVVLKVGKRRYLKILPK